MVYSGLSCMFELFSAIHAISQYNCITWSCDMGYNTWWDIIHCNKYGYSLHMFPDEICIPQSITKITFILELCIFLCSFFFKKDIIEEQTSPYSQPRNVPDVYTLYTYETFTSTRHYCIVNT